MVLLNLLPHREQAHWRQRRHWHGMLGVALGVAVLAGVALYAQGQQRLGRQERATAVLEEAVARLGPQLAEVRKLDAALREGRTRLQQWQAWQQSARQPLRLLELLARELPPGTGLTRVEQEPGQMVLQGLAVSREAATALRELIDGSGLLAQPALLADMRDEKDGVVFRLVLPLAPVGSGQPPVAAADGVAE